VRFEGLTPVGDRIAGRYRLESAAGGGGDWLLHVALDLERSRQVVLKFAANPEALDDARRQSFDRGIERLFELEHPHVVRVLDGGLLDKTPFAVVAFLGGGTLRDRLAAATSRPRLADVLAWLRPMARALDDVHAIGLAHGNVDPSAVLFDLWGNAFLDVPGALSPSADKTSLDEAKVADRAALARLAWRVLTGEDAPSGAEVAEQVASWSSWISTEATGAFLGALSADPRERHASCAAFVEALAAGVPSASARVATDSEDAAADMAMLSETPPPAWARRLGRSALLVVGALLVLLAAVGFLGYRAWERWWQEATAIPMKPHAVLRLDKTLQEEARVQSPVIVRGFANGTGVTAVLVNGSPCHLVGVAFSCDVLLEPGRQRIEIEAMHEDAVLAVRRLRVQVVE